MTNITLSYDNALFELKSPLGHVLWSGRYNDKESAVEFARSYVSSFTDWSLCIDKNMVSNFDEEKRKRDFAFFNKEAFK